MLETYNNELSDEELMSHPSLASARLFFQSLINKRKVLGLSISAPEVGTKSKGIINPSISWVVSKEINLKDSEDEI